LLVRAEEFPDVALHGASRAPGEEQSGTEARFPPQASIEGALELPASGIAAKLEELERARELHRLAAARRRPARLLVAQRARRSQGHLPPRGPAGRRTLPLARALARWPEDWKGIELGESVDASPAIARSCCAWANSAACA
jgi:hypothetical protein